MYFSLFLYGSMLAITLYSTRGKNIFKRLGYNNPGFSNIILKSFYCLCLLFLASILIGLIFTGLGFSEDAGIVSEVVRESDFFQLAVVMIIGSIVEEIFFRGFLQKKTNLIVASFVFAGFHLIYGSMTEVFGAFFLGMILGIYYNKTKGITVPTIAHLLYNMLAVSVMMGV